MPDLVYPANASFLFDREQPLVNERDIRYNIRAKVASTKGDLIGFSAVYLFALVLLFGTLACIYTGFEMFAHILAGEFVFQATGNIIIVIFVLRYILRFTVALTSVALLQTWFWLDKRSEERLYHYLIRRGRLSTGRVTNVVYSYESSGVYFAYNKWKDNRYFASKPPQIGSPVVVLHNWIIAVLI